MDRAEFDKFADEYSESLSGSIKLSGEGPEYFAEYKVRDVAGAMRKQKLTVQTVLDFGCGTGGATPYFKALMPDARLSGVDVSSKSLDIARQRFGAMSDFREFDGQTLPFADGTFDVVFASCVFHHIPQSAHVGLLAEIRRVLSPTGTFFVFEHNPLNPLTRRVVRDCPFDENAVLMKASEFKASLVRAGLQQVSTCYRVFFPRALSALRRLESYLTWCPMGAQYYLSAKK